MRKVVVTSNMEGQRLEKVLKKCLPDAPLSFFYKMLRKKNITLNGKKATGKEITKPGDEISFFLSDETYENFSKSLAGAPRGLSEYKKAYEIIKNIQIIYEDEHVLILNKPENVLSQKADGGELSLNEWMIGYLLSENAVTNESLKQFKPSVCNRLDRNTSGLILCGKSLAGSQLLSRIIKERSVKKFYRLFVYGDMKEAAKIQGYLKKNEATNKVQILDKETEGASYIETYYEPLKQYKDYTYLEVELITGKSHQIRAHLSSVGYPLIGDKKYGNGKHKEWEKQYKISNQLLHAYRLEFPELSEFPKISGKVFVAPEPAVFEKLKNNT